VVLTLLAEAKGVPVIFAVLLPSGNVVLEVRHCTFQAQLQVPALNGTARVACITNHVRCICVDRSSRTQRRPSIGNCR
jgi:hypothetical protein